MAGRTSALTPTRICCWASAYTDVLNHVCQCIWTVKFQHKENVSDNREGLCDVNLGWVWLRRSSGGSIPSSCSLHVEVFLSKTLNCSISVWVQVGTWLVERLQKQLYTHCSFTSRPHSLRWSSKCDLKFKSRRTVHLHTLRATEQLLSGSRGEIVFSISC